MCQLPSLPLLWISLAGQVNQGQVADNDSNRHPSANGSVLDKAESYRREQVSGGPDDAPGHGLGSASLNGRWPFRGRHAHTCCRPPQQANRPLLLHLTPRGLPGPVPAPIPV